MARSQEPMVGPVEFPGRGKQHGETAVPKTMDAAGEGFDTLLPATKRQLHAEHVEMSFASPQVPLMGTRLELLAHRKDGDEFFVEIVLTPLKGSESVVYFIRDVTESRKQIEEVRNSEQHFRAIF